MIEWNTLFTNWRKGAKDQSARGANAINVTYAAMDPFFAMVRFSRPRPSPPVSQQLGLLRQRPEFDKLIAEARTAFDQGQRDKALARCTSASSRRRRSSGSRTTSARAR